MSDSSQGPGWWLASDGKWYPPEPATEAQAPQPPPPAPPPPAAPTVSKGSTSRGCMYSLIALAAFVVLGGIALVVALVFVADQVGENVDEALQDKPCPFLSDGDARDVFGDGVEVISLTGFNELLEITGDNRVLEDAPSCIVRETSTSATLARVARYQGTDAESAFAVERDKADGLSEDRGGGLSVETEAYLSDVTVTVGDEGFCTTASLLGSSGALVRKGDTLVYAGVQPNLTAETPEPGADPSGSLSIDDEKNCREGQEVAGKIVD